MRTFRFVGVVVASGLGAGSAAALDPNLSPSEAFRSGYEAYKAGDKATALEALGFAAEKLHPAALWKLGRMYATGDLVDEDDKKALELFATRRQRICATATRTGRTRPSSRTPS